MAEQLPGGLICPYSLPVTGVTSLRGTRLRCCGVRCRGHPPRKGPGTTSPWRGPSSASGYEERSTGVGYVHIRADGRAQLHIHAEITTEDDKKIALFADGVLNFRANSTVGDLREYVTLTTSEHGYTWVNPARIWALGRST